MGRSEFFRKSKRQRDLTFKSARLNRSTRDELEDMEEVNPKAAKLLRRMIEATAPSVSRGYLLQSRGETKPGQKSNTATA
jgi:hypothetical protein